jgi:hypothetical protein
MHQVIARQARPRDAHALAQVSSTLQGSLREHSKAYLLTKSASKARSLQEVREVLGTPRDAEGRNGSGILGLTQPLQIEPLRELNFRPFLPRDERGEATIIRTEPTLRTGDPEALSNLVNTMLYLPHDSPQALPALRTLWGPVNIMPLANAHRRDALFTIALCIRRFPLDERVQRFGEHLAAWKEVVAADPSSAQAICDTLSQVIDHLPPSFQDEARSGIEAIKVAEDGPAG